MRHLSLAFALLLGCSGSTSQVQIGPVPERVTNGTLSGPACQGDQCKCATTFEEAGVPEGEATKKRFEIKLQSAQELWVTLPQNNLYKSAERAEACFKLRELAPQRTDVVRLQPHQSRQDKDDKPLEPDDFPVRAEKKKILKNDGETIAEARNEKTADEVAERLNAEEQIREEDRWA